MCADRWFRPEVCPVNIRPFIESDARSVLLLWSRCGLLRPWNDPRKDIARKLEVQRDLFMVGEVDGRVVAVMMAGYEGHRGWVNYLAVEPELQGHGLGRQLMEEAERRLVEMGCPKVQLQVRRDNAEAVAFYRSLGYLEDEVMSMGKRLISDEPAGTDDGMDPGARQSGPRSDPGHAGERAIGTDEELGHGDLGHDLLGRDEPRRDLVGPEEFGREESRSDVPRSKPGGRATPADDQAASLKAPAAADSAWADPDRWRRLRGAEACVICGRGSPRDLLVELEGSWVTVNEDAPMPGCACLVARRHAVELHDLSEAEAAAFMRDGRRLSAAVQQATGAVKLNYEVHGNTVPHLHLHVYPRYPGDPFVGRPIDPKAVGGPVYGPGQFEALRRRLLEALGSAR